MTITMTAKHQVTLPKQIADAFGFKKGTLFDVHVRKNIIELIPLEVKPKEWSLEDYKKMDQIFQAEQTKAKRVTKKFIAKIKKGYV